MSAVFPTMLGEKTCSQRRACWLAMISGMRVVQHRVGHAHVLLDLHPVRAAVVGERDARRQPVEREQGVHAGGGVMHPLERGRALREPLALAPGRLSRPPPSRARHPRPSSSQPMLASSLRASAR